MGRSCNTGDKTSPECALVCEAMRKDNIREYAITYDDDLVRGKVGKRGKCSGRASIGRLE
jgi:hypothetical protein